MVLHSSRLLNLLQKVNIIHLIRVDLHHFPLKSIDLGDYLLTLQQINCNLYGRDKRLESP